jgi:membrane protein
MLKTVHQKTTRHLRPLVAWLKLLWRRIDEDNMTTLAGNLAYVSLLSLVPLIAVVSRCSRHFRCFLMSVSDSPLYLRQFHSGNRGCHSGLY